jgi:hypothetical protein
MFAVIALIIFILALFKVHIGSIDLVILGLAFIAAHLAFAVAIPLLPPRRQP